MKFFNVHPDDARWLRRWLRSNVCCFLGIVCFALAIRLDPVESVGPSSAERSERASISRTHQSPTVDIHQPVVPRGWRRTAHGWEDVSNWPGRRSLGEIISLQRDREPAWIRFTLASLREVPPLLFALVQIIAIVLIMAAANRRPTAAR